MVARRDDCAHATQAALLAAATHRESTPSCHSCSETPHQFLSRSSKQLPNPKMWSPAMDAVTGQVCKLQLLIGHLARLQLPITTIQLLTSRSSSACCSIAYPRQHSASPCSFSCAAHDQMSSNLRDAKEDFKDAGLYLLQPSCSEAGLRTCNLKLHT